MITRFSIPALAFLLAAAATGRAGEAVSAPAGAPAPPVESGGRPAGWLATTFGYTHQFETDVDGSDTAFSADRWQLEAGTRIPFSDAFAVAIGLEAEWSQYEFDRFGSVGDGLAAPADDLFSTQAGAIGFYEINESWELVAGGSISWGGDLDADFEDGLGATGLLGLTYRFTPNFSLTPGVLALSRLEDDALVIPVIGMDWQINNVWRLRSIGPGAELTWQASDQWGFFLRGLYRSRDYRLAPDASQPSGVLRERTFPLSLGVEWKPNASVTAAVFGGAIVGGRLELQEEDGRSVFDEDYDVTPIAGGSLKILF